MGNGCFYNCTGLSVWPTFGSSITSLPANCFSGCTGLNNITISKNIISLGNGCFYNCTGLSNIIFANSQNILTVGSYAFTNTASGIIVSYYNAINYSSLPTALQNSQGYFNSPTYYYYPYPYPEPTPKPVPITSLIITQNIKTKTDVNKSKKITLICYTTYPTKVKYYIKTYPSNGKIKLMKNKVYYTPNENFVGIDKFKYYCKGSGGIKSNTSRVKIFVV